MNVRKWFWALVALTFASATAYGLWSGRIQREVAEIRKIRAAEREDAALAERRAAWRTGRFEAENVRRQAEADQVRLPAAADR